MAPLNWILLADLNGDGVVNFVDFAGQVQRWLMSGEEQLADLNRDGVVNRIDLSILAERWLKRKSHFVVITEPENGASFPDFMTIEIEADAWCIDGSVIKVEFFANGSKIGEDSEGSDGWNTYWEDHPWGYYGLTAKATYSDGAIVFSALVRIELWRGPPPP